MPNTGDRILLVEDDPKISDLIARQTLNFVGYQVEVVTDASSAIKKALHSPPDLIIADLNLPGLSTKDLLVALASQGVDTPLLVIANKGQEQDIIQAFRLGAADYILWPARDAEVLSAVERVLARVRSERENQRLDRQVAEMNEQLQRKVRELTAIIGLGKAVTSITDQRILFQKIVDGAAQVTGADIAWLLIREREGKTFLLSAQHGLPPAWAKYMNMPLDDGISALVALSGETLAMEGDPLSKFRISSLGKSVCVVPIKVQLEVIGMLVVVRREVKPFTASEQTLLEAVADYASISLVNARLFRALNEAVQSAREAQKRQYLTLENTRRVVMDEVRAAIQSVDLLLTEMPGALTNDQRQALQTARAALQRLSAAAEKTMPAVPMSQKTK
ncbi:MAG: response regulator [Chloroflexota bacterium]|nr:response regulator [Chloroflexota bacterium]MBI5704905.1 response regulator [Chloroflexota bacterium]